MRHSTVIRGLAVLSCVFAGTVAQATPPPPPPPVGPKPLTAPSLVKPVGPVLPSQFVPKLSGQTVAMAPPETRASAGVEMVHEGSNVYYLLRSLPPWNTTTGYPITLARSTDGGRTYLAPVKVAAPSHFSTRHGRVAVRGSQVVVTWTTENALYFALSSNGGASFGPAMKVVDGVKLDGDGRPIHEVAFTTTGPVVVYQKGSNALSMTDATSRIWFARLAATGATGQTQIGREPFAGIRPKLGVDGNRVVIAYSEDQNPVYLVSIAQSNDEGKSWDKLASPIEGDAGMSMTDSERAHVRLPTAGSIVKPIFANTSATVENVFVFGAQTIVTIAPPTGTVVERALVAAEPTVGLFHGRMAVLARCAEAERVEPAPLAPRGSPIFSKGERGPLFFVNGGAGIEGVWSQGWTSTDEYRGKLWRGRFTGAARMSDCSVVTEEPNLRLRAVEASGAQTVFVARTSLTEMAFGAITGGHLAGSIQKVTTGRAVPPGVTQIEPGPTQWEYGDAVVTPSTVALGWIDTPGTDFTGTPKAMGIAR